MQAGRGLRYDLVIVLPELYLLGGSLAPAVARNMLATQGMERRLPRRIAKLQESGKPAHGLVRSLFGRVDDHSCCPRDCQAYNDNATSSVESQSSETQGRTLRALAES